METQTVGNCEFNPSTSPHPTGTIHPTVPRAQPGTLNLAPRVPERSKHFVTAPSTRSEGSVGAQSFHFWAGWLLLGALGTPGSPQRAGPAEPPAWLSHHPLPPSAPCSSFMAMLSHLFPLPNKCQHGLEPSALYLISQQNNPGLTVVPKVDKVS